MPNVEVSFGRTGAKRATWKEKDPRPVLARLVQNHPDDEPKWRREFWAYVKGREDYLRNIVEHWLDLNIRAVKRNGRRRPRAYDHDDQEAANALTGHVSGRIKKATFDYLGMHVGDRELGDYTGREGRKLGGWFTKLFKGIPAKTKLRDMRTNEQLAELENVIELKSLLG